MAAFPFTPLSFPILPLAPGARHPCLRILT